MKSPVMKRVSNYGRIQSIGKAQNGRKVLLKPTTDGYVVATCKGIGRFPVHVVVNVLFNDPDLKRWKPGLTTDHKDRVRSNNHAFNLKWATGTEQRKNQVRNFGEVGSRGGKFARAVWCRFTGGCWRRFESLREASDVTGLAFSVVRDIAMGKTKKTSKGVDVKFAETSEPHELPGEVWKPILDTVGFVSNMGRIQSTPHSPRYTPTPRSNGRCYADVGNLGVQQVGRLVLCAFDRAPVGDESCDHKDRDPLNNNLSNLCWATKKEQIANQSKRCTYATRRPYEIQAVGTTGWIVTDATEASKKYGIDSSAMSHVANPSTNRKTTKARDGTWYYVRYAPDSSQEDAEGEEWKDIVVADWVPGGKYACVRRGKIGSK